MPHPAPHCSSQAAEQLYGWTVAVALGLGAAILPLSCSAHEDLTVGYEGEPSTAVMLSLEALDALPRVEVSTSTPWTKGVQRFSGPPLRAVLDRSGIKAARVRLVALNDYSAEISDNDIGASIPIVATRINGEPIPVRTNGPYWIIFPYDSDPKFRSEVVLAQSVWQLISILAEKN